MSLVEALMAVSEAKKLFEPEIDPDNQMVAERLEERKSPRGGFGLEFGIYFCPPRSSSPSSQ